MRPTPRSTQGHLRRSALSRTGGWSERPRVRWTETVRLYRRGRQLSGVHQTHLAGPFRWICSNRLPTPGEPIGNKVAATRHGALVRTQHPLREGDKQAQPRPLGFRRTVAGECSLSPARNPGHGRDDEACDLGRCRVPLTGTLGMPGASDGQHLLGRPSPGHPVAVEAYCAICVNTSTASTNARYSTIRPSSISNTLATRRGITGAPEADTALG